jgi:hypothetical protein
MHSDGIDLEWYSDFEQIYINTSLLIRSWYVPGLDALDKRISATERLTKKKTPFCANAPLHWVCTAIYLPPIKH